MLNEFHGREYTCSQYIPSGPGYEDAAFENRVCAVVGSQPGSAFASGTEYVRSTFSYVNSHRWRNFGILIAMTLGLTVAHLVVSEIVASTRSKGEVLVFRRGKHHIAKALRSRQDEERTVTPVVQNEVHDSNSDANVTGVERQTAVFHWQDVSYEVKAKGQQKLILDRVDGWVKPGTLTALMGVSGAGKTTLLDVLASRTTIGVITGEMLVNGQERDDSVRISFPGEAWVIESADFLIQAIITPSWHHRCTTDANTYSSSNGRLAMYNSKISTSILRQSEKHSSLVLCFDNQITIVDKKSSTM